MQIEGTYFSWGSNSDQSNILKEATKKNTRLFSVFLSSWKITFWPEHHLWMSVVNWGSFLNVWDRVHCLHRAIIVVLKTKHRHFLSENVCNIFSSIWPKDFVCRSILIRATKLLKILPQNGLNQNFPIPNDHLAQRGGKFFSKFHSKLGKECPNYYWSAKLKPYCQLCCIKHTYQTQYWLKWEVVKIALIFNKNRHST